MKRAVYAAMKTRTLALAAALLLCASRLPAQQRTDRFSGSARLHDYVHSLVSPTAVLGVAAATALDQIRDDPAEWSLGERALSNAGRLVVQTSIQHGIAAVMDRSTWYYRCGCRDTGARVVHAFGEAFTDHDRSGQAHFSVARVAGAYGASYAEAAWRPGRSGAEAFVAGTTSLIGSGVLNLWREFIR